MNIPNVPGKVNSADLDQANPIPEGFTLVDVREDDEWEAGHAPGALHIPLGELADRIDELPDGDLMIVCRKGGRSANATDILSANGIEAWDLTDGMQGWAKNGLPLASEDGDVPTII